MNIQRFSLTVLVVFLIRTVLNYVFYGVMMTTSFEAMQAGHEDLFREVIPAYVGADLFFALVFVLLYVKVSHCLGAGAKGGLILGVYVALLGPVLLNIYHYFSVTYMSTAFAAGDSLFQLVSSCISGVVAATLYKAT